MNLGKYLLLIRADGPVEPGEVDAVRALRPVSGSARAEVFGRCGMLVDAAFGLVDTARVDGEDLVLERGVDLA